VRERGAAGATTGARARQASLRSLGGVVALERGTSSINFTDDDLRRAAKDVEEGRRVRRRQGHAAARPREAAAARHRLPPTRSPSAHRSESVALAALRRLDALRVTTARLEAVPALGRAVRRLSTRRGSGNGPGPDGGALPDRPAAREAAARLFKKWERMVLSRGGGGAPLDAAETLAAEQAARRPPRPPWSRFGVGRPARATGPPRDVDDPEG